MSTPEGPKGLFRGLPSRPGRAPVIRSHSSGNMNAFWQTMALKVSCSTCGALVGVQCVSVAKDKVGAALDNSHTKRISEAKRVLGRK